MADSPSYGRRSVIWYSANVPLIWKILYIAQVANKEWSELTSLKDNQEREERTYFSHLKKICLFLNVFTLGPWTIVQCWVIMNKKDSDWWRRQPHHYDMRQNEEQDPHMRCCRWIVFSSALVREYYYTISLLEKFDSEIKLCIGVLVSFMTNTKIRPQNCISQFSALIQGKNFFIHLCIFSIS